MTVEKLDRDIAIFKDQLIGLSHTLIAARRDVSRETVQTVIKKILKKLKDFVEERKLKEPFGWELENRLAEKDYFLDLLSQYQNRNANDPAILLEDSVDKLGITPLFHKRLNEIKILTVGDLLERLVTKKNQVGRLVGNVETAIISLERKIIKAGFDPYGGREQTSK